MPRLFFALWPDGVTRAALTDAAALVDVRDGRRVRPENLHLTLRFLGEVTPEHAAALDSEPLEARVAPFEFTLEHAGWWRASKVTWLAPLAPPDALGALAAALDDALAERGFEREPRPFRPHVTIARGSRRAPRAAGPFEVRWAVQDFALVASVTDPAGARYEVVRRWPLGAAASD